MNKGSDEGGCFLVAVLMWGTDGVTSWHPWHPDWSLCLQGYPILWQLGCGSDNVLGTELTSNHC